MFKKVLVANRGEIAVRIVRALRDLGLPSVALYDSSDLNSLHVRLADECVELKSPLSYMDGAEILRIAQQVGAEAIHPGYGFLAESPDFIRRCEEADVTFIGPPSSVAAVLRNKIEMLERAKRAGFRTPKHSSVSFTEHDRDLLEAEAQEFRFPVVIKACAGGRGRGARLVRRREDLLAAAEQAYAEAQMVFGDSRLYLEEAVLPARFLDVQIVADKHGTMLHLGERDGSLQRNNQKLLAETPSSGLTADQREELWRTALEIARLFNYINVGTVEFLVDAEDNIYFTEIKARITLEHPVTEMVSHVDLVREQVELAAGKRITQKQEDIGLVGWAMGCRINAEDPWNHYLPSPGHLRRFRLPGGPNVRVDTYGYSGSQVPTRFDPLLAKLIVWGEDRDECLNRVRRALQDFAIGGIRTNLALFQRIMEDPDFVVGHYTTEFLRRPFLQPRADVPEELLRDLAIAAALAYQSRYQSIKPVVPERLREGWARFSRQL